MKYSTILERLKLAMDIKFPDGQGYAPKLAEILGLHERTIYRKLSGETHFSIEELSKITNTLDIQVSDVLGLQPNLLRHPLELWVQNLFQEPEFQMNIKRTTELFNLAANSETSKFLLTTNSVPEFIFAYYDWPARMKYLKWIYFTKGSKAMIPLSSISFPEESRKLQQEYLDSIRTFKRTISILYNDMMKNVVEEILFFYQLNFITQEEAHYVLDDYIKLIDKLEEISELGYLPSNKKEVEVYYSEIPLFNDMVLIDSEALKVAITYVHCQQPIITQNQETFNIFREWFNSSLRSSNIISISGAKNRWDFFNRQKNTLAQTKNMLKR